MKEAVFILIVVLILFTLTAVRYRRQINTAVGFWKMLKAARQQMPQSTVRERQVEAADVPLVNCAKCSRWVPETTAIRLGTKSWFCSRECFEKVSRAA